MNIDAIATYSNINPDEILELTECEEIINEESSFLGEAEIWGDNQHYEVENSLTRALAIILIAVAIYYLVKAILKPQEN